MTSKSAIKIVVVFISGTVLTSVLIILLASTITWFPPTPGMLELIDDFELQPGESIIGDEFSGDRFCFLQCADWSVRRTIAVASEEDFDTMCASAFQRGERWLGHEMTVLRGNDDPDARECFAVVHGDEFGNKAWNAYVSVRDAGPGRYELLVDMYQPS